MVMKAELLDDLLKNCKTQEDVFGENGVMKQIVKALAERVLQTELTTHLGYEKHEGTVAKINAVGILSD